MRITLKPLFILALATLIAASLGCSEDQRANLNLGNEPRDTDRDNNDGADTGDDETPPALPTSIVLVAEKSYGPSRWADGVFDEAEDLGRDVLFQVVVPEQVPIVAGNAGNHALTIVFDEDGANIVCSYKGGADVSKPIRSGNPVQIEKGMKYVFQSCSNGTDANSLVSVDATIRVIVNNGDSTETTRAQANFDISE